MSDTPFGFGSPEWLGDTPGSEDVPTPEELLRDDPVTVARWEWNDTNGEHITLYGYDADGFPVARRTFKYTDTSVRPRDADGWTDVDESDNVRWDLGVQIPDPTEAPR